ncbi:hypothetical protein RRG08_035244 [Elysia crispata]|uniref:Uncharacterized protein n=1 Tax=Elysia crispata TaxID=231223 RepID=A0AAE0ZMJ0_9GAST|nr:hypothetical protein RRG08_035244 [Elysia crispata]
MYVLLADTFSGGSTPDVSANAGKACSDLPHHTVRRAGNPDLALFWAMENKPEKRFQASRPPTQYAGD